MPQSIDRLFQSIQKQALPGVWSKGLALAREYAVLEDRRDGDEIQLRVKVGNRPVSPKVTLWPEDDDAYCDCGDRNEPCFHIVAAVVALKNGLFKKADTDGPKNGQLIYRFVRTNGRLELERLIIQNGKPQPLTQSLVGYVGGITSGRIIGALPAATRSDYGVDRALSEKTTDVLKALKDISNITLDNLPIKISTLPIRARLQLRSIEKDYQLTPVSESQAIELFSNALALVDGEVRPYEAPRLSARAEQYARGEIITSNDRAEFFSEIFPELQSKLDIVVENIQIPQSLKITPRLSLKIETLGTDRISVTALIVYAPGSQPAIAHVYENALELLSTSEIPLRDLAAETALKKRLQQELHLQLGRATAFEGMEAVKFIKRSEGWEVLNAQGAGGSQPKNLVGKTHVEFELDSHAGFRLKFSVGGKNIGVSSIFKAWNENQSYVALGGGWAELPQDWLNRYGKTIEHLLAIKAQNGGTLPTHFIPKLLSEFEDFETKGPGPFEQIKKMALDFQSVPSSPMPPDLTATLRDYQFQGVHWLNFLKHHQMGALLADDMGLGKTLQAICAIPADSKQTLIVVPTSVLSNWTDQLTKFRPGLTQSLYYGPERKLDLKSNVVITTYGILRSDVEALSSSTWDMIVLDESQNIKNPESQTAYAARKLRGLFKLAMTGTPVENRLTDLWSQFEFLNPGLLEKDADAQSTRKIVRPFLLRRTKEQVAKELPPRTEIILRCELSTVEREKYTALLQSSRAEVLEKLNQGKGLFSALEALLRLRQACCHLDLVPGLAGSDALAAMGSAKTEMLMEHLEEAISGGHKALVFSQWTSFLDLIEPHLRTLDIDFLRIDGTTTDRAEIISRFQTSDGPPVLLLSLKAGGVGLTLTEADYVFLMDPWWNPATEQQAADRAHRIGQTRPVMIHKLVAKDTIEEKILLLQASKLALSQEILENPNSNTNSTNGFTREDLLALIT